MYRPRPGRYGAKWASDGVGIRLEIMLSRHPHRRAFALVSLLGTLLASVQVLGGCEEPSSFTGDAAAVSAESSAPVDACACLCACGCPGAVAALLPAIAVGDQTHLVGPGQVVLEVTPPTVSGPAPPTEPPRG